MNQNITEHPTEPGEYIFTGTVEPSSEHFQEVQLKEVRAEVFMNEVTRRMNAKVEREDGTIQDWIGRFVGSWKKNDPLPKGQPANSDKLYSGRVFPMPPKPFTPREPDWKRLYYSLSLKVYAAAAKIEDGNEFSGKQFLEQAVKLIEDTERKIELCESIVSVQTKEMAP